jgi:hypothetical protein
LFAAPATAPAAASERRDHQYEPFGNGSVISGTNVLSKVNGSLDTPTAWWATACEGILAFKNE